MICIPFTPEQKKTAYDLQAMNLVAIIEPDSDPEDYNLPMKIKQASDIR